jgi:hypothetical protein
MIDVDPSRNISDIRIRRYPGMSDPVNSSKNMPLDKKKIVLGMIDLGPSKNPLAYP